MTLIYVNNRFWYKDRVGVGITKDMQNVLFFSKFSVSSELEGTSSCLKKGDECQMEEN